MIKFVHCSHLCTVGHHTVKYIRKIRKAQMVNIVIFLMWFCWFEYHCCVTWYALSKKKKKKRHVMKVRSGQLWLQCSWSSHMSNCLMYTVHWTKPTREKNLEPSSKITHQCYRCSKQSDLIKRNHIAMGLCWSIWTVSPYVPLCPLMCM